MLLQTGSEDGKPEPDDAVAVFLLSEVDINLRAAAAKQNPEQKQFQDRFLQGRAGDHCWKVPLRDLNLSFFVKIKSEEIHWWYFFYQALKSGIRAVQTGKVSVR